MAQFGAICDRTKLYTMPSHANKVDTYSCVDCKSHVIIKQGEVRKHHFCHAKKSNCMFYEYEPTIHGGESEYHINAKHRIKSLLETQHQFNITSHCHICNNTTNSILPIITDDMNIILEYNTIHNDERIIADVACVKDNKVIYIIEILHTHHTEGDKRPDPWWELYATDVINYEVTSKHILLNCCRNICTSCFTSEKIRKEQHITQYKEERRKQQEQRNQQEEQQRKQQDEQRKQQDEQRKQQDEQRKQQEEQQRKQQEEHRKQQEEQRKQQEEHRKQQEEERKQQEEEQRKLRIKELAFKRCLQINRKAIESVCKPNKLAQEYRKQQEERSKVITFNKNVSTFRL